MDKLLSTIQRKLRDGVYFLVHCYRHSWPRNWILALKSRDRTKLLVSGGKRFVVFLVPGLNTVNGGIISICSIAKETEKLLAPSGVMVAVCTAYGEPRLLRFTKFQNDINILALADLLPRFPCGAEVLVHVPELFVQKFVCERQYMFRFRPDLSWRFNILLQNIDLMPPKEAVEVLRQIGATTATFNHKASTKIASRLGCPIHYLSWGLRPENFERMRYSSKRKLIVISPDYNPAKLEVVRRISETLPDHKIIEIQNMTYEKYKSTIKYAKFAFTFGEGLDGYFVESIFSGGVAMAIYSERFFTPEYRDLAGVFPDEEHAISGVGNFLKNANNEDQHKAIAQRQYDLVAKTFVWKEYLNNLSSFYQEYFPELNGT
jgi:hypothetical protein